MIEIYEQGPSISGEQVDRLEEELDARLSDSYRRFLILHNGGRPDPDVIDIIGADDSPTDVQVFFGIGRAIESSDISWNLALVADRLPGLRLLPIACDSGGNLFCLKVVKGIASVVFYFDLNDRSRLYEVAPDFDSFWEKIRQWGQ